MADQDHELRAFAGYNMKRAFNVIQADVNATLAEFGLRMVTWSALSVIRENGGLRQSHLADILSIERPNLVVLIDELERADLITRDRDTGDRRAYCLNLTEAGKALYERALTSMHDHETRMTLGLSEDERNQLILMLRKIEANRNFGETTNGN